MKLPPRAALAALALAFALAGCKSTGKSAYGQYYSIIRQAVSTQFGDGAVSRAQAAKIEYASLGYRLDGGAQQILILATDTGGDLMWTSANRVVLVTHDGRIRRSVNLPKDLGGVTNAAQLPAPFSALKSPFSSERHMDFPDMGRYGVSVQCRAVARRRETVTILGAAIATMRVEENCNAQSLDWRFSNIYWVDPGNGLTWQSEQHIHPKGGTIQLQIFRPPS